MSSSRQVRVVDRSAQRTGLSKKREQERPEVCRGGSNQNGSFKVEASQAKRSRTRRGPGAGLVHGKGLTFQVGNMGPMVTPWDPVEGGQQGWPERTCTVERHQPLPGMSCEKLDPTVRRPVVGVRRETQVQPAAWTTSRFGSGGSMGQEQRDGEEPQASSMHGSMWAQ